MNKIQEYKLISALQAEIETELTWEASQAAYGFLVNKYRYSVLRFLAGVVTLH